MDDLGPSSVPDVVQADLHAAVLRLTIQKLIDRINRKVAHRKLRLRTTRAAAGIPPLHLLQDDAGKPIRTYDDVDLKQIALDVGALRDWEREVEIVGRAGLPIKSVLRGPQPAGNVYGPEDETSRLTADTPR